MISVLHEVQRPALEQAARPALDQEIEEQGEFEIVMGRGQLASTMLLMLVLMVVLSGGAYVIGKSASPRAVASATGSAPAQVSPPAIAPVETTPVVPVETSAVSAPVYGDQAPGRVYLQVGAVDRGLAGIWAEGLRTHGLDAFVAPGPSEKMWRVVIGPLPTPDSYQRAKAKLDELGINTFGRKQQ
jgi:hypothetical protein